MGIGDVRRGSGPAPGVAGKKYCRVTLWASNGEQVEPYSLWVDVTDVDGALTFTLLHDYPDCKPAAGWRVEHDGALYQVVAVDGRALHCGRS